MSEDSAVFTGWLQDWVSTMPQGIRVEHAANGHPFQWDVYQESGPFDTFCITAPAFAAMKGNEARQYIYDSMKQFFMVRGIDHFSFGPTFYFMVTGTDRGTYAARVKAFDLESAAHWVRNQPGTILFETIERDAIPADMLAKIEEN